MNLKGAKPVVDIKIKHFITSLNPTNDLYNEHLISNFIDNFFNWIKSSKLNHLANIDQYTNKKLCSGTIQAFDHFYWKHKEKRFRFFNGEFMYHKACLKHGARYIPLNGKKIMNGDEVIVSIPFSDYGTVHPSTVKILNICNNLEVPVLLDFAYYPCTKNIDIDLNYSCIDTIAFSISKAFYGGEFLRVGIRLQRDNVDDGIDAFNSVNMHNRISISIANALINKYPVDHNWDTYANAYAEVCKEKKLETTDCIMFGLGGKQYKEYNRGSDVNRVCISELVGQKINEA